MNKTKTWDIEKEKNTSNKNPSASSNCIERIINQTITYVIRIKISCDENMSKYYHKKVQVWKWIISFDWAGSGTQVLMVGQHYLIHISLH